MRQVISLSLPPKIASEEIFYKPLVAEYLNITEERISVIKIRKKSIDARCQDIKVNLDLHVFYDEPLPVLPEYKYEFSDVSKKEEIIIAGSGPAGLFAALKLIQAGIKPIILERGKDVSARKRDIAKIYREHLLDENSNYCFGEGGAGTFSDGKLYTKSKKRGDVEEIFNILCYHGAGEHIFYEAHPHIGTDKLPGIIKKIRETIIRAGGEIHFNSKVTDFIIKEGRVLGVVTEPGLKITGKAVVLATGHSARDIYELLALKKIPVEAKPFAMGVRVEHLQELIDTIRYHSSNWNDYLPAASYKLVSQIGGRGVYSFCMCPGGFIVPSSTSCNEMVVNGMSPSGRNTPYANSGIVVEVRREDIAEFEGHGELAGLRFQQKIEQMAFLNGGHGFSAPAQRLADFVQGRISSSLPENSYIPGVTSSPVHFWLPEFISRSLQEGFRLFDRKMHGFLTNEALVVGVESRTSSPVRIIRDKETFQHPYVQGLYPCGEGAGYAGGIVSSAIDGMKCAEQIKKLLG